MADRFFIAPYDKESGLQTNVKPWLVPDEAFTELNNAYVFRGRVRKRFGTKWTGETQLQSRLRIKIGTTDAMGDFLGRVPSIEDPLGIFTPIATPAVGQMFSIGGDIFTVNVLGAPATLLSTDITAVGTFDTTATPGANSGEVTITGSIPLTDIYYYPALPVMGIASQETTNINDEPTIVFDTRFAYQYSGSGWERLATETTPGAARWTGSNSQFFWTTNWTGTNAYDKVLFVSNFNASEPNFMRIYTGGSWDDFRPQINAVPDFLNSARILVPFKNRLVAFNTWEGPGTAGPGNNYQNRCRYSGIGDPTGAIWDQTIPGQGNAIDAPITEAIITVEFIKDRLIVFFERSTWELVYTGNQAYPFVWQQINTELGAESTFSIVPFDKVAIGVGQSGIHACNGVNVERIDDEIPDEIFKIQNENAGTARVYGIRDYDLEMVYWSLPSNNQNTNQPYPNRVLVYNYKTGTWAYNDDSITAFGYMQDVIALGITWDSETVTWDDTISWDSGTLTAKNRQIIGGNQEGYVFIISPDITTNAQVLQITDLTVAAQVFTVKAIDHNLKPQDYVYINDVQDTGNLNLVNDKIFQVITITKDTFTINYPTLTPTIAGTYLGGGTIARVSRIGIRTKEYNFYASQGRNAYISKVDFMVDRTDTGQLTVDFFVSTNIKSMLQESNPLGTNALLGTSTLDTSPYADINYEATATRLWRPLYFQADGEVVQLQISLSPSQMMSNDIRKSGFEMHAMVFTAQPTTARLQ